MVRAAGVEPTTFGSGNRRSIQLSYARVRGHYLNGWNESTQWAIVRGQRDYTGRVEAPSEKGRGG